MALAADLIARCFAVAGGELLVGGVRVGALAERYGTPLFVYDASVLDRTWAALRGALPPEFDISYSVKANPNRAFMQYFIARGCGLEIASAGEFHQAVSAGCPPERILFAGPGKTDAELELVLAAGIGEIHAESPSEIERLGAACRRAGVRGRVAIRVNPGGEAQGGAMRMGGRPAPFGVDEESLDVVLDRLQGDDRLELRGIHLFAATQVLDHRVLVDQWRKGLEIAARAVDRLGRPLRTLDFGGGLGIPYFAGDSRLDMDRLGADLAALMAEVRADPRFAGTRFLLEPGRYLVGESGVYLTRVVDVKMSRGRRFVVVDGGMNHHLAASGNLGQVLKRNFPVALVSRLDEEAADKADVVGPLCTPLDILARELALPQARPGDLVGVLQSGAYARTASPLGFLSHPTPPEVWVRGGEMSLIRRRGTLQDLVADLEPLPGRAVTGD